MKPKKIICLILSALLTVPCLCFASCDSANVGDLGGDIGGLSTDETQKTDENKTPLYTAPAKYKEIAKSDKVYRSGIYTGYSIVIRNTITDEQDNIIGHNLNEVMLDYPGEALPVHEDPTCSHDSFRCPTSSESMSKTALIVDQDGGLPVIFYFCLTLETVYSEEGEAIRTQKVTEVRGYDVETGEYTTVAKLAIDTVGNAILYKGRVYAVGGVGFRFGMVDIVTGESKVIEAEDYYNEYNILGIKNDRLYYMHVFGNMVDFDGFDEEGKPEENRCTLKSCSLDLDDVREEYDFGDFGSEYERGSDVLYHYSYLDGSMLYFPRDSRLALDPAEYSPDTETVYNVDDLKIFDVYALDLNDMSAGEKLMFGDVYKFAVKNGKIYYTFVDYEEVGEVSTSVISPDFYPSFIRMFASTDGGTLYEYDTATEKTRELCRDSGYNIYEIYEITDDGKILFNGTDYVNYVPAEEGNYTTDYQVGRKEYCMLDISTGEVTVLYSTLYLGELPEGEFVIRD